MNQIPMRPTPDPEDPPSVSNADTPKPKRRSIFGTFFRGEVWLGSSPIHWLGVKSIRQGASFIGDLAERSREGAARDPRFKTAEEGTFDLPATAFGMGLTVSEVEARLLARRRQTAVTSYVLGMLGAVLLLVWFCKVVATPMASGRIVLAIDFLPLCLLFVLVAFYQALVNFQIRTGRAAGWREYLTTEDGFWPRS